MSTLGTSTSDYLIVGAGSAGCLLANRLSADGRHQVTVLEAGGSDRRFWIQVPIGYGRTFYDERVNWCYETAPEPGLNGRRSYWPRGKVLGGSSSINAMVYIRGQRRDFDDWRDHGNPGWGADDVLPYFQRFEERAGLGGELHVHDPRAKLHPLVDTYLSATRSAGFKHTPDFNAFDSFEGTGTYHITTKAGRRHSTARAFLHPVSARDNLQVITHAHVTRVIFNGTKATGVEFERDGVLHRMDARREVILCGGAINSPQLLQLSGIGDADLLTGLDIPVLVNQPAVGANLQDHLGINYYFKSRVPTLNNDLNPWYGKLKAGLQYLINRGGHLSLSVNQAGGFVRTDSSLGAPNLQLYFTPISYTRAPEGTRPLMNPDPYPAFFLSFQPSRPTSRGSLRIRSTDPFEPPDISPNYLGTDEDIADALAGCRLMRELASQPALKDIILEELQPGPQAITDADLIEDFRARSDTVFHPVSTCIMGSDPARSVVGPDLKVHGVDGLRIIDASVFPNLTSGNTNAPTIMVAEKGADIILSEQSGA